MRPALRPWKCAAAALLAVNALFLLLALWAARLPRDPLEARVRDAFGSGELIENDWPGLDARRGFNQYHDCSVLQMVTNRDAHLWAAAVGPLMYNRSRGETDRCATLRTLVTEGPGTRPYLTYRYTRYWHGYVPVTAALLSLFQLSQVRLLLMLALYASLLLLVPAAGFRERRLLAVAGSIVLAGVLFWSVPYFGKSLTHGPGDIAVVLGLVILLRWRHQLVRPEALVWFCALYGAVLVYLEFLTALLPTGAGLLVPLVYLASRARNGPDGAPATAWRLALTALVAFGVGAVACMAIKQILAVIVVGSKSALVFAEYLQRYVNPSPGAALRHFGDTWTSPDDSLLWSSVKTLYVLLTQGHMLTYGSHRAALVLYGACTVSWLAAGWIAFGSRRAGARSDFLGCAAGVAIVVAWALGFQTHTTIHKWWMVRMLLVPLSLGWGVLAWQLLSSVSRPVEVEHSTLRAAHGLP
jgi:hypothetical protein